MKDDFRKRRGIFFLNWGKLRYIIYQLNLKKVIYYIISLLKLQLKKCYNKYFIYLQEIKKVLERFEKSENDCFDYNLLHIARQLISEDFINNDDPSTRVQTAICICKIIAKANSRSPYTDSQVSI